MSSKKFNVQMTVISLFKIQHFAEQGRRKTLCLAGKKRYCCFNVSTVEYLDDASI